MLSTSLHPQKPCCALSSPPPNCFASNSSKPYSSRGGVRARCGQGASESTPERFGVCPSLLSLLGGGGAKLEFAESKGGERGRGKCCPTGIASSSEGTWGTLPSPREIGPIVSEVDSPVRVTSGDENDRGSSPSQPTAYSTNDALRAHGPD